MKGKMMSVNTTQQTLTREQAEQWIMARGIHRLPRKGESMQYNPPGVAFCAEQFVMERVDNGFLLKHYVLTN
jgi:hypothetical protein